MVIGAIKKTPPHTIISVPVQTAVWPSRASGALTVLVAVQVSVVGLYLPPVLKWQGKEFHFAPPQTIISLPVQTAVCSVLLAGALVVLVGSSYSHWIVSPAGVR